MNDQVWEQGFVHVWKTVLTATYSLLQEGYKWLHVNIDQSSDSDSRATPAAACVQQQDVKG